MDIAYELMKAPTHDLQNLRRDTLFRTWNECAGSLRNKGCPMRGLRPPLVAGDLVLERDCLIVGGYAFLLRVQVYRPCTQQLAQGLNEFTTLD